MIMKRKPLKSKLIDVFKMMYGNQFEEFDKFVSSPYFGCRLTTIKFYSELKKHYPEFNISKEELFENFYGRKHAGLSELDIIRKMCDELYLLAERYFAIFTFEKSVEKVAEIYSLTQLKNIKNRKIFEKKINILDNRIHNPEFGITEKFFHRLLFYNSEKFQFYKFDYNTKNTKGILSETAVYNLCNFIMESSRIIANSEAFKDKFNYSEDIKPLRVFLTSVNWDGFLESIKNFKSHYSDVLTIYTLRLLITLEFNSEKYILQFKKLLFKNSHRFYKNVNNALYVLLNNYYNSLPEQVDLKNAIELNEIYDNMIKDKLFDGEIRIRLSPETLSSFIINNCELHKFDKADRIMNTYLTNIDKRVRDDMYNYCMAVSEFYKNNFGSSLEYISKTGELTFLLKYNINELKLMLFYELNYFESAASLIDSYRHYLSENKHVTDKYEEPRRKFLIYYSKLHNLKFGNKGKNVKKIISDIIREKSVLHIRWLYKKLNEF